MYTKCTEPVIKEESFQIQMVKYTLLLQQYIAFGMGLDCPNVRQILHWEGQPITYSRIFKKLEGVAGMDT